MDWVIIKIPPPRPLQLQWSPATGRPRPKALQVRAVQANGGERREAGQALCGAVAADVTGHTRSIAALDIVHAQQEPDGDCRVQVGHGHGYVSSEYNVDGGVCGVNGRVNSQEGVHMRYNFTLLSS